MDIQAIITDIYHEVKPLASQGQVAKYIPALETVSPDYLAISIHKIDGTHFSIGDYSIPFSIQSIAKVFGFTLAYKALGSEMWKRVGKEPSGNAFNSLVQLEFENGIPRNPFINAGAIVLADILISHYKNPPLELLNFAKKAANETSISFNEEVARSEKETGNRNAALAYFMKSYKNIVNPVQDVLDLYFLMCSLEMDTYCLAKSFLPLSNQGIIPSTKERIVSLNEAKRINSLMITSGLYNESGDFAYRVGVPAKSGVGGGIVAVIPNVLSICVWSPPLNNLGNSIAGVCALEKFTTLTGISVF
ncbi:MAG: glutaminase [Tenuifilaceae bacterium]|nr:glutaminase [Tenuifilaceae bacterium]